MVTHISDKKAQKLLELQYCEKQMRKENKYIKQLKPYYDKQVKKVRHLETTIITHDKLLQAWSAKRDAIMTELSIDQQAERE